jgi:hypothetical protein
MGRTMGGWSRSMERRIGMMHREEVEREMVGKGRERLLQRYGDEFREYRA